MAFGLIYLIIDGTNDKEYVGQTTRTVEERFQEHKHCKTSNIGRAIRKHGVENFATAILKVCDSQEELNYWEKHFIISCGTRYPSGYNNSDGGEGGWECTPKVSLRCRVLVSDIAKNQKQADWWLSLEIRR